MSSMNASQVHNMVLACNASTTAASTACGSHSVFHISNVFCSSRKLVLSFSLHSVCKNKPNLLFVCSIDSSLLSMSAANGPP